MSSKGKDAAHSDAYLQKAAKYGRVVGVHEPLTVERGSDLIQTELQILPCEHVGGDQSDDVDPENYCKHVDQGHCLVVYVSGLLGLPALFNEL